MTHSLAILYTLMNMVGMPTNGYPQLDLPPIATPTPQPLVYYNGFPQTTPAQLRSDFDRSQRYGPPYIDDGGGEDGVDDYRNGQTYDKRMRYGYSYPQPLRNFSDDTPFSSDIPGRHHNHNYDNPVDQLNDNRRYNYRIHDQSEARNFNAESQIGQDRSGIPNTNYPNNVFNTPISNDNYPNQNYPNQNYPNQNYPNQNYPNQNYPNQNYPIQNDPNQNYPTRGGVNQNYPNQNQHSQNPQQYYPSSTPNPVSSTPYNNNNNPTNIVSSTPFNIDPNRNTNFDPNFNPNLNRNPDAYPRGPINVDGRLDNPYPNNNPDRFNLNDRFFAERQRYQSDRRYQIELEKLRNLLVETDNKGSLECQANVGAQWNFETNVNPYTQAEALNAQQHYVDYQRLVAEQSKYINKDLIFDRCLYRQLMLQSEVGPHALPIDGLDRYNRLVNEMLYIYNGASICAYQQPFTCNLRYIPELREIMSKSRDWDELSHTWVEYHRKAGREMRDSYEQLIDVMNEVANANNVTNGGEFWFLPYESMNFRDDVEIVWEQIRPLYEALHAYVRRKLREYYGPERINRVAPIPAHILGNMFAQSWTNIIDIIIPYPGRKLIDITPRMLEQGYTPLTMVQLAEDFFTSINMSTLGPDFYQNSIFERPIDREVLCEPSAWDFCNRVDFRVKMCTDINQKNLLSVHHELAHIHYFLQYRHQPKIFRNGANPAFHQAIGDAITLSVATPKHYQTLGLLQRSVDESSYDINYLFTMALDKVAFLPFALAVDNWRYDVFSGRVKKRMMNCHYWDLRERYGGLKPPRLRSERDFDIGGKYHIPANIPYMKYFVSTVLQFQIYRGMCLAAGQYIPNDPNKPLHKCDIYRQPAAGNLLKQIMAKGASQPWQEVLEETLGTSRLDGSALREYFAPLEEWLRLENLRTNDYVGWTYDGDYCKRSIETAGLQVSGGFYNSAQLITWQPWAMTAIPLLFLLQMMLLL